MHYEYFELIYLPEQEIKDLVIFCRDEEFYSLSPEEILLTCIKPDLLSVSVDHMSFLEEKGVIDYVRRHMIPELHQYGVSFIHIEDVEFLKSNKLLRIRFKIPTEDNDNVKST